MLWTLPTGLGKYGSELSVTVLVQSTVCFNVQVLYKMLYTVNREIFVLKIFCVKMFS